jgi:formylglycine-generating enzyme required for sulfatase activity
MNRLLAVLLCIMPLVGLAWSTGYGEGVRDEPKAPGRDHAFQNSIGMKFVLVPKGKFWMGGTGGKAGEKQQEIEADFYLGATELTQGQWQTIMDRNPSYYSRKGDGKDKVKDISDKDLANFPVESVSWDDVKKFIVKLNEKEKGRGRVYRLPTEAEWEFACRGGATSKEDCSFDFYLAKPSNDLSSLQANFVGDRPGGKADKGPFLDRTCIVASYPANRLGLHDMHGNVWEWCEDSFDGGPDRVVRGGSLYDFGSSCRAATRLGRMPNFPDYGCGFRVALGTAGVK